MILPVRKLRIKIYCILRKKSKSLGTKKNMMAKLNSMEKQKGIPQKIIIPTLAPGFLPARLTPLESAKKAAEYRQL